MSIAQRTPGPWGVYPYVRGYVVMRDLPTSSGVITEALASDGTVKSDASRRDCFYVSAEAAQAAITKATEGAP